VFIWAAMIATFLVLVLLLLLLVLVAATSIKIAYCSAVSNRIYIKLAA